MTDIVERTDHREHIERMPAEAGTWLLLFGDLLIFGSLFVGFLIVRSQHVAEFRADQARMSAGTGLAYTILLLVSSLAVVLGLRALRAGRGTVAGRWILAAALCGTAFVVIKLIEWHQHIDDGLRPSAGPFFMWFYMLAGLHLFHVIVGLCMLTALYVQSRQAELPAHRLPLVEGAACFWHLVDLLWLVLFPLLYLVR